MWRIIEIPDEEASETDLSDGELIGISISLRYLSEEPDDFDVYWRARRKIQPQVEVALARDD